MLIFLLSGLSVALSNSNCQLVVDCSNQYERLKRFVFVWVFICKVERGDTMDLIIREVENYGWLALIVDKSGNERYRSGVFFKTPKEAYNRLIDMMMKVAQP